MFKRVVLAAIICPTTLISAANDDAGKFDLGIVEVTGKQSQGLEQYNVDVVSDADIRKHGRNNVAEALNLVPGVTVQNIGRRGEQLIFVRGFNSRQVPLFIDGIPVYVPYDGNIDLGRFMTFDIAEINVAKGFTSVLYGANTMGGAINLVSRRPDSEFEGNISAGFSADSDLDIGEHRTHFNMGSNQGQWYVQAGGSWSKRTFFGVSDDFEPSPFSVEDGDRRDNAANEDYKVSLKVGFTPNATDEYAVSYYNQQGQKETPLYAGRDPAFRARFWRWPEYDKESIYFLSRTALGEMSYLKLRAYYDTFENTLDSYDDVTFTTQNRPFAFNDSVYDDYTYGGGMEFGTEFFDGHLLKAAFNYKRDIHRETDDITSPEERFEDEVLSVGIEDTITVTDRFSVVGGVSYDQQKGIRADNLVGGRITSFELASEDAVNVQGGIFYNPNKSHRVHATLGLRTRFPTIKDRYSFRFGSALPNADLQPERATNAEIGLQGSAGMFDYGATVFKSWIDDAIENVTVAPSLCARPPCFQLQNIGQQTNKGTELFLDAWVLQNLRWHVDYTHLSRSNDSSPTIKLLDTPRHKVFTFIEYSPVDILKLIASVEYQSSRFSETNASRVAKGFVTGNLNSELTLPAGFTAQLGVQNIADRYYEYEEGFPEPGRTYYANLRFSY